MNSLHLRCESISTRRPERGAETGVDSCVIPCNTEECHESIMCASVNFLFSVADVSKNALGALDVILDADAAQQPHLSTGLAIYSREYASPQGQAALT